MNEFVIAKQDLQSYDFGFKPDDFEFAKINLAQEANKLVGKPTQYLALVLKRFFSNRWAFFLFLVVLTIILLAIFVPIAASNQGLTAFTPVVANNSFAFNLPPRLVGQNPQVDLFTATLTDIQRFRMLGILDESFTPVEIVPGAVYHIRYLPYQLEALKDAFPLLGTDNLGVDIWTKLWTATGISFLTAFIVALFAMLIGVIYGAIAGSFAGKLIDTLMMRFVEIVGGIPSLIWLLVIGIILVNIQRDENTNTVISSLDNNTIIITLILILWFSPAVSTRTYILKNKDIEYVQAAKTLGGSQARIIFAHMLPVVFGRIVVIFVNLIPGVIFYDASLVFLNLKSATDLSLGVLLSDTISSANIPLVVAPIFVFATSTISFQIIANALNDAIDPRVISTNK